MVRGGRRRGIFWRRRRGHGAYGKRGGNLCTTPEEEITCLSSDSETGGTGSESEVEMSPGLRKWLAEKLAPIMRIEGSPRRRAKWKELILRFEDNITRMTSRARKKGYEEAASLNSKQLEDVEELLDK